MPEKDDLTQNLGHSRRVASAADGPNLMQEASRSFMRHTEQRNCHPMDMPESNWEDHHRDYVIRDQYDRQTRMPGASTFHRGSMLFDEKKK